MVELQRGDDCPDCGAALAHGGRRGGLLCLGVCNGWKVPPSDRGPARPKRNRINPESERRKAEREERREAIRATYGRFPDCSLCAPLREHGIVTGCNGRADDADERLRRSAGGSITDMANVRPVGRRCHDWIGANPKLARDWGLVDSRYGVTKEEA